MNKQIIVRHQNVGFNFSFQQGALVLNCLLTYLCGGWGARQIPEPRCMSRQRHTVAKLFKIIDILFTDKEFCFSVKIGRKIWEIAKSLQLSFLVNCEFMTCIIKLNKQKTERIRHKSLPFDPQWPRKIAWCQAVVSLVQSVMVFCHQNCSDLLWEKIVLVIEKNVWDQ